MLRTFIDEYKEKFLLEFEDDFWGNVAKISAKLTDPSHHPSLALKRRIKELKALEYTVFNIAVIGQFSSGKSTFINTLLNDEILPTGVVPVTAKPTYIKYAPHAMLHIAHQDGRIETLDITELGDFVDQRKNLKDIKNITIYSSNEILKQVTLIDTPGLNSRNRADTKETLAILEEAFGVIWLSLIDNAARASEQNEINLLPKILKTNSICLLSQKDKFSDDDVAKVLKHADLTFGESFTKIIPVSSKIQKIGDKDSGFDEVFKFFSTLEGARKSFAISRLSQTIELLKSERTFHIEIYEQLKIIIKTFNENSQLFLEEKGAKYLDEFAQFYAKIQDLSSVISEAMLKYLGSKTRSYFKPVNGLFSKNSFEKIEYEAPYFDRDEALSKLIYNDDRFSKLFKKFKDGLLKFEEIVLNDISENYKNIENEILLFKGKFESIQRYDDISSIEEVAATAKIASEVYELFLKEYEKMFFKFSQNLSLFFEKIQIKIIANYQNSVILTADFINNKIKKSIEDYEDDPVTFGLYYPKFDEVNRVLLNNLHYYEFEDDFISNKAFITKNIKAIIKEQDAISSKNLAYIDVLKERHINILKTLKGLNPENL